MNSTATKSAPVKSAADLKRIREQYLVRLANYDHVVLVCGGAGCVSSGCAEVREAMEAAIDSNKVGEKTLVLETGCIGTCSVGQPSRLGTTTSC